MYGDLFGSWGVAVIATDYVLDSHMASPGAAHAFLQDFLRIIQGREILVEVALPAVPAGKHVNLHKTARSPQAEFLALGLGHIVRK